jgi:signal transduction histidine kinase
VVVVAVSLSAAFIFAGTGSTRRIAESSRDLHWTNSAAATASTMRAALSQAIVFAVDRELGVATDDAAVSAVAEAARHTESFEAWLTAPAGERPLADTELATSIATLQAAADRVIVLLADRDVLGADAAFVEAFEPAYQVATGRLTTAQQALADEIVGAESLAGRVESGTRLLVTLLIPVIAILVYRQLAKRELHRRRLAMDAKLEAERELGRAKDDFIAGISHELRTPLTSIYGFSEYLLDHSMVDPAEAHELVGLINRESADLSRMVEDLLTAARLDAHALSFHIEPVSVVGEMNEVLAPMRRSGHDIRVHGHDQVALADRARLHQVMRNLVSNAIKHGGPRVEVSLATHGETVTISVSDDGTGVTEGMENRLFERFAHEGESSLLVGSVGLGLSIGRTLAHGMGGDIVYEPDREWTTFTLSLPKAPDDAHVEPLPGREPTVPEFGEHSAPPEALQLQEQRPSPQPSTPAPHPLSFDHG